MKQNGRSPRLNEILLKLLGFRSQSFWLVFLILALFMLFFWSYYLFWQPDILPSTLNEITGALRTELSESSFVEDIFSSRKEELDAFCHSHPTKDRHEWLDTKILDHVIIDDKRQLIYCYIPKVACTNWKRILLALDGRSNYSKIEDIPSDSVHRDNVFVKLSDLQPGDVAERIQNYDKLIFVRHPFERIVSAFRNKFEKNYKSSAYFKSRFGVSIQKLYRSVDKVSPSGDGVQFSEFVQYVIDVNKEDPKKLNEHWAPYTQLCLPCDIRYNLIGKYETLHQDASYVLKRIKASEGVQFPLATPSNTTEQVAKYISSLSETQISELFKIYDIDFKIFGYHSKREEYLRRQ